MTLVEAILLCLNAVVSARKIMVTIDDTGAEWKKSLHRTMVGKFMFGVIMIPSFSRGGSVCTYDKLDGPREDSALRQVAHYLVSDFALFAFRRNRDNARREH